jgi:GTP-binding protein YchF
MQVALIGLAQSGKSTLFSAVTEGQVHTRAGASHQADRAVVTVPDERLEKLAEVMQPKKVTHATIELLDFPGLSFADEPGRHEARRIVAQGRQVDMLVWVIRGFHNDSVAAYRDRVDPAKDLEELKNELLLADLELVANRIEKLRASITKPTPHVEQDKRELALMERCHEALENVRNIREVIQSEEEEKLVRSFGFLTLKPILAVVNIDEDDIGKSALLSPEQAGYEVMSLSAQIESELAVLAPEERQVFLQDMGLEVMAKDRFLQKCYRALQVISFFTFVSGEVRAWTVPSGSTAVEAAGAIHNDIQRGFIRAETVHWEDFVAAGDMKAAKAAGKVRLEGKTYQVQDGDIITFRFNV